MNKKGTITDVIYISVIIFAIALAALIFLQMSSAVYPALLNTTLADDEDANATMTAARDFAEDRTDYMVTGIIMIMLLGILLFAYLATANTIFTVVYVVILILSGILAGIFQWSWERITANGALSSGLANMPITNFILSNFVLIMVVVGVFAMVLMYIGYATKGGSY